MKKINMKALGSFLLAFFVCCAVQAQGTKDIRINELLVKNGNGLVDDFGKRSGWIELHNTGYSAVDVGSCYLTTRIGDKTKTYRIPAGHKELTTIPPRGYLLFFASNVASNGLFHTNFALDEGNYIALLSANGKDVIDDVTYDLNAQREDVSIGYPEEDSEEFGELYAVTPRLANYPDQEVSRAEQFVATDPYGIGMAIVAMLVVFTALLFLFLTFKWLGKFMNRNSRKTLQPAAVAVAGNEAVDENAETVAAITMALKLYVSEQEENQAMVLTINRVAKTYSPWSSKIHGLTRMPEHKK